MRPLHEIGRVPKEATCDAECVLKAESLRSSLSKKRKKSQLDSGEGGNLVERGDENGGKGGGGRRGSPISGAADDALARAAAQDQRGRDRGGPRAPAGSEPAGVGRGAEGSKSKKRFIWPEPLHRDFVAAVFDIGLKCASPKLLLEMMAQVEGLTSEHIKSHLQKYRLHRQRSREDFLKNYGYLTHMDCAQACGNGGGNFGKSSSPPAGAGGAKDSAGKGTGGKAGGPPGKRGAGCDAACNCHRSEQASPSSDHPSGARGQPGMPAKPEPVPDTERGVQVPSGGGLGGCSEARAGQRPGLRPGSGPGPGLGPGPGPGLLLGPRPLLPRLGGGGLPPGVPAAQKALLQTHLDLVSRSIQVQSRFQEHLRALIESQKELKQRLDEAGARSRLPPPPSPPLTASAASAAASAARDTSSTACNGVCKAPGGGGGGAGGWGGGAGHDGGGRSGSRGVAAGLREPSPGRPRHLLNGPGGTAPSPALQPSPWGETPALANAGDVSAPVAAAAAAAATAPGVPRPAGAHTLGHMQRVLNAQAATLMSSAGATKAVSPVVLPSSSAASSATEVAAAVAAAAVGEVAAAAAGGADGSGRPRRGSFAAGRGSLGFLDVAGCLGSEEGPDKPLGGWQEEMEMSMAFHRDMLTAQLEQVQPYKHLDGTASAVSAAAGPPGLGGHHPALGVEAAESAEGRDAELDFCWLEAGGRVSTAEATAVAAAPAAPEGGQDRGAAPVDSTSLFSFLTDEP